MYKLVLTLLLSAFSIVSFSQADPNTGKDTLTYRIIRTDGGELIGKILSQDEREVYVLTSDNRKIYIPQHLIKQLIVLKSKDFKENGDFVGEDKFATRYFLSTNGLPIKKGEHYLTWNLFGPEFQFAVGENFGVGIMTSWLGAPIIASVKKSWQINENTQLAAGALIGTASWIAPGINGALPFGAISFGDRTRNLSLSAGYGAIFNDGDVEGRGMTSIAGMIKVSTKISLIFDSFILLPSDKSSGFALLIPGLRWHKSEGKAFQFGFTQIIAEGQLFPVPIPTVQWFRTL